MRYSVEKPGSPSELVHFGVKGMKWGVRREGKPLLTSGQKDTVKKVVKGTAAVTVAAGAAFIAYKLGTGLGSMPVSSIPKASKDAAAVSSFLSKAGSSASESAAAADYAAQFLKTAGRG